MGIFLVCFYPFWKTIATTYIAGKTPHSIISIFASHLPNQLTKNNQYGGGLGIFTYAELFCLIYLLGRT